MKDAQTEIKATVTVNTGEGIAGKTMDEKETGGSKEASTGGHNRSKLASTSTYLFFSFKPLMLETPTNSFQEAWNSYFFTIKC